MKLISTLEVGTSYIVDESTDSEVGLSFHLPFRIESKFVD